MFIPHVHPAILRSSDQAALQTAEALVKAATAPEWPAIRLKPTGKMTLKTLAALQARAGVAEVQNYLADLAKNGYRVDSRQWHYVKYKYEYGDPLASAEELDGRFEAVLADRHAVVYLKTGRIVVYSAREHRLVIVATTGQRITVYRPDPGDVATLGGGTWQLNQLIV